MTSEVVQNSGNDIVSKLILDGDISKMTPAQKVDFTVNLCKSLGLNPLTQPFQIIKFQGKEKLYPTRDCTDQLRKIHGVGITEMTTSKMDDVYIVTVKAIDKAGRIDTATGALSIAGLKGEALSLALMKAETKAKRRVTLSIIGLGMMDESELSEEQQSLPVVTEDAADFVLEENKTPFEIRHGAPMDEIDIAIIAKYKEQAAGLRTSVEVSESATQFCTLAVNEGISPAGLESLKDAIKFIHSEKKKANTKKGA